ncbi:WxL domain-containing protein [Bacillus sp. HSf4]|uniref:WxL domain-containing protein n=1 Tax=Bacillus sp. HSf4 TaxID=3035514 RepID=UPI0024095A01|nr:WxL domain-containing protein [Bacillus sp. HSf4]WFA03821.1 WxL domain-containing protein [Bacillus sp. HSf4]
MKPVKVLASLTVAAGVVTSGAFSALAADGGEYDSKGIVEFTPSTGITPPVDPENPGEEVEPEGPGGETPEPGTNGPLSIDFASSFNFGTNEISNKDEVYYAAPQKINITDAEGNTRTEERANYVQISDNRGTNAGWTLQVQENGQLSNSDTLNSELTGAEITLTGATAVSSSSDSVAAPTTYDITLDPAGTLQNVMTAQEGEGAMTWLDYFGTLEEVDGEMKNTAVQLSVPGTTPKDAVEYSTTLTWTLSDVVTNS